MRVRSLWPAAILLLWGATAAHAGSVTTGIHAGASLPIGDDARSTANGFHAGVSLEYVDESRSAIGIDANLHAFPEKTSVLQVWGAPISIKTSSTIFETALYFRAVLPPNGSRLAPYFKGGFGIDHVKGDLAIRTPLAYARTSASDTWFGLLGGIGVAIPVTDATDLRLEALFHRLEADGATGDWFTFAVGLQ